MYITRLEKVEKTIPEMEGAKDIYKQIPLSKKDGVQPFHFEYLPLSQGDIHHFTSIHLNT